MTVDDRLVVRELVDRYAQCVDRCDGPAAAALFAPDAEMAIERPGADVVVLRGRDEITAALRGLDRYRSTMHVIASHTATVDGDGGAGETRCIAHHLGEDSDHVMHIRYADSYVRLDGGWHFAGRTLHVEATEDCQVPGLMEALISR